MGAAGLLLKDFKSFAEDCTQRLASHAEAVAREASRPYFYLESSAMRKEDVARSIAERDGVRSGLVCVLSCVEPCRSFNVRGSRRTKRLELVKQQRKCRFFYFYYLHRDFGLMHVRLQSWLPFDVQVCINGRSYLQRQLDRAGIGYTKADNVFTSIDDLPRAQRMLDRLTKRNWCTTLNRIVGPLNPLLKKGGPLAEVFGYYWTFRASEFATDVMFKDEASLQRIYPRLCRHAIEQMSCGDVLRFLGKKRPNQCQQQVNIDLQRRVEGVRVKHYAGVNSIKMYDKQGCVLRIETTINDPSQFRVLRRAQGDPRSKLTWRKMRKGVADTARRVTVCRDANHRYLEALAVVEDATPAHRVFDSVSQAVKNNGYRYRGLRPVAPEDAALFQAVMRGEHLIDGLTNRDVQNALFDHPPKNKKEQQQRTALVSRKLRLLRSHGLIRKVARHRRYRITPKGHQTMTLTLTMRQANTTGLKAA